VDHPPEPESAPEKPRVSSLNQRTGGDRLAPEQKKEHGMLNFNSADGHLPTCSAFHKVWGFTGGPERLCVKFLTGCCRCTGTGCKFPHVSNIAQLPNAARKQFIEFVKTRPGLSWVEGKEPPGATQEWRLV
jgi:hypothetical protein